VPNAGSSFGRVASGVEEKKYSLTSAHSTSGKGSSGSVFVLKEVDPRQQTRLGEKTQARRKKPRPVCVSLLQARHKIREYSLNYLVL
jgi:hypothetical protein